MPGGGRRPRNSGLLAQTADAPAPIAPGSPPRFERRPADADADALLDAAMGPLSLAVTTMYLRQPHNGDGHSAAAVV